MLRLLDGFNDVLVKPFMPDGSVVTLDLSVLLRLARLDMLDLDVALLSPFQELVADVFRAIVDPDAFRLSPPFNDPVQAPDNSFGG